MKKLKGRIGSGIFAITFMLGVLSGCQKYNENKIERLAVTPPMGFNSFDSYRNYLDQETARKLIDIMAEKYLPFGYDNFIIDLGWYSEYKYVDNTRIIDFKNSGNVFNIDENGLPEPSKTFFPDGIKTLADYAHKKGLKFGLHLMRGVIDQAVEENCIIKGTNIPIESIIDSLSYCEWCPWTIGIDMNKEGAQEYYDSMVEKLAGWNIDFIKYDDMTGFPADIIAVSKAIEKSGRPITLSLSPGDDTKIELLPYYQNANMLRITHDIWDTQQSIDTSFEFMKKFQGLGMPGFWPDLDMLAIGNLEVLATKDAINIGGMKGRPKRKCLLNSNQVLTFITQRAIAASPLFIGGDLLSMDKQTYEIIINKEMIECNQNGVCGFLTYNRDSIEIYKSPDRNDQKKGWIAIFNRKQVADSIIVNNSDLGFTYNREFLNTLINSYSLKDIWNDKEMIFNDSMIINIPADGVKFMSYKEQEN